jgi:hypothetical protein
MRVAAWLLFLLLVVPASLYADEPPDAITQARELYNQGRYVDAISAAELARAAPALTDRADLIAARAYLERYRASTAIEDLTNARDRLRRIAPERFDTRERTEYIVGLGEALYFEESYGAAAQIFESVLDDGASLSVEARERVLDWWAIAVDREAWSRPDAGRQLAYDRIRSRMRDEVTIHPGSATAGYWLAAAARSQGDLQAAWDAAEAGWVRATLAMDRGAALRAELDQLMLIAIVPERARALAQSPDVLRLDWESFKERWKTN